MLGALEAERTRQVVLVSPDARFSLRVCRYVRPRAEIRGFGRDRSEEYPRNVQSTNSNRF